jgi:hypothetical protein
MESGHGLQSSMIRPESCGSVETRMGVFLNALRRLGSAPLLALLAIDHEL